MNNPEISVILGSYNRKWLLKLAIQSVRENGITVPYEIIIVDGGSTDGSLAWLLQQKDVITIVQHNRGTFHGKPVERRSWGYFMNLGFKCAQGKFILMISDDSLLVPGSVMNGFNYFEHLVAEGRKVGAVAFYWRNWPEDREYRVGLTFGGKMFVNHGLFLRDALERVDWIDEERYMFYHADGDLCLKLWQHGYEVVDCPDAFVEHFVHANLEVRGSNLRAQAEDWSAYLERWAGIFYHPEKQDSGGAVCRAYCDPHDTAARFFRGQPLAQIAFYLNRARNQQRRRLEQGFKAYADGDLVTARRVFLAAVWRNPFVLRNLGIVSILAESCLGPARMNQYRNWRHKHLF
jgi:glycosyltransferase involved in cell wall biosynthesis